MIAGGRNGRAPVAEPLLTRPRVLLADDYDGIVRAIARLIAFDCDVVGSVSDGATLLDAAERLRPDVIVLDLNLPKVSGLDACRLIRRSIAGTKIIVMTATTEPTMRQAALAAGASSFISKSAVGHELLAAIRSACTGTSRGMSSS